MNPQEITPLLMFSGQAEEAMTNYVSIFDRSEVLSIQRYGPNEEGPEGSVLNARFVLRGLEFICFDSPINHGFTFTPAISFFVTCDTEEELDRLFSRLEEGGQALMPVGAYPFSKKFGWVQDKYGVSWQLNIRPQ